ncbi:MAG: hypothetical protein HC851_16995 [Acaryochloris sp. RU_4_1]|nr:hypothetical protein [Acaryochloris sp. RU_4_1]NJR55969.1 hypothetical protein [Acaryochloris sp. CRU_2_0]
MLRYGRQQVNVGKKFPTETTMMHHANKPCPETAARMGTDMRDTVLEVSQSSLTGKVEANPVN